MIFDQKGDFEALYAAENWCTANGYSYGSLCRDMPVGLLKGDYSIAKWKNLTAKEKKELAGTMESKDFRNGPVIIKLKGWQP